MFLFFFTIQDQISLLEDELAVASEKLLTSFRRPSVSGSDSTEASAASSDELNLALTQLSDARKALDSAQNELSAQKAISESKLAAEVSRREVAEESVNHLQHRVLDMSEELLALTGQHVSSGPSLKELSSSYRTRAENAEAGLAAATVKKEHAEAQAAELKAMCQALEERVEMATTELAALRELVRGTFFFNVICFLIIIGSYLILQCGVTYDRPPRAAIETADKAGGDNQRHSALGAPRAFGCC